MAMEIYKTSDLYLSAFLKAKGLKLLSMKKEHGKSLFVFQERQDREQLIQDFLNDGIISVSAYKSALQDLKTLLFNM